MVFESRLADLLQTQAARFLQGFSAEQLRLGVLSGRLELCRLALNPEPLDTLLLESEVPLVVKAGLLSSAAVQLNLLQGELELSVDGLTLLLGPVCRWLTRAEVLSHRASEIQRLEFVHTRSQSQRRSLEREMFRQLFADYLSRLRISVRNVHLRLEVEGECAESAGSNVALGLVLASCRMAPLPLSSAGAVASVNIASAPDTSGRPPASPAPPARAGTGTGGEVAARAAAAAGAELLLAERVDVEGLLLYEEAPQAARVYVDLAAYHATRGCPRGIFERLDQARLSAALTDCAAMHAKAQPCEQLMPPTSLTVGVDMRSQPLREGFHLDNCLTMEVAVRLAGVSRLNLSWRVLRHAHWFARRAYDVQLWHFLHPMRRPGGGPGVRWRLIRTFLGLKRRVQGNRYALTEALAMRTHCKEYVRLYKRKFNGPSSAIAWRKSMVPLTDEEAARLEDIELLYPADKLVNFRVMAHAELKTEAALNGSPHSGNSPTSPGSPFSGSGELYARAGRELTPLERLHLHGQHGYGAGIYRGLPPPSSSLKIRIDVQAPSGLWWVCGLEGMMPRSAPAGEDGVPWAVALDCAAQPARVLLVDSLVDASVFATLEVPAAAPGQRPLSVLLGRSPAAFAAGSPGRSSEASRRLPSMSVSPPQRSGGSGDEEWCSLLEVDGALRCCSQVKTVLTSSPNSPWDVFVDLCCGDATSTSTSAARTGRISTSRGSTGRPTSAPPLWHADGQVPPASHPPPQAAAAAAAARVRIHVPLRMPSGRLGPLPEFLRWCSRGDGGEGHRYGPANSSLAWLAHHVSTTRNIAVFRVRVRLPPLVLESGGGGSAEAGDSFQFPCVDAACHLEHGGLADGFVVGLHHLRHFASAFLAPGHCTAPQPSERDRPDWQAVPRGSGAAGAGGGHALALSALEEAPPLSLLLGLLLAAVAVAIGGRGRNDAAGWAANMRAALQRIGLAGLVGGGARRSSGEPSLAAVSLALVTLAVVVGRRALWELRDSQLAEADASAQPTAQAMSEMHGLLGCALQALLLMGVPLHERCASLAAWAGAVEVLEVALPRTADPLPRGLVAWAARGTYANLPGRQATVVRWLLKRGAPLDEPDELGRTLLDWACWGGDPELVGLALRGGMLPAPLRRAPGSGHAAPFQILPPPLTLAVASRSAQVVNMLLRAASDPHAPPGTSGSSPLLLATRCCEYELGCEMLRHVPCVAVSAALGPTLPAPPRNSSTVRGLDPDQCEGGPAYAATSAARATAALLDSLRRFASVVSRFNTDELAPLAWSLGGARGGPVPGPHPDEGLYATGQVPFIDILHPLAAEHPLPIHRVRLDHRPQHPPLRWVQFGEAADLWVPARFFVQCCLERGFRLDEGVVSRAMPSLPPEVCGLVHCLVRGTPLGLALSDPALQLLCPPPPDLLAAGKPFVFEPGGPKKEASDLPTLFGSTRGLGVAEDENTAQLYAQGMGTDDPSAVFAAVSFVKDLRHISAVTSDRLACSLSEEVDSGQVAAYLQGGVWHPAGLPPPCCGRADAAPGPAPAAPSNCGRRQGEAPPAPHGPGRPAVRVVVLGSPQVGKTTVAECLAAEVAAPAPAPPSTEQPAPVPGAAAAHAGQAAWLRVAAGSWPRGSAPPRATVHVWDCPSAPLPGLLSRLALDPLVPTLAVVVVDAALADARGVGGGSALAAALAGGAPGDAAQAPRRVVVVENVLPGPWGAGALGEAPEGACEPSAPSVPGRRHTAAGAPAVVRCDVRTPEGASVLRRSFGSALTELIGEAEARLASHEGAGSARSLALPWLLPGRSFSRVHRSLGHQLRGDAALFDPSAASWAWAAVRAAQGGLSEGGGGSRLGGAFVLWERMQQVLSGTAAGDTAPPGAGPTPAPAAPAAPAVLLRALADLGLVCPIAGCPAETGGCPAVEAVLVPDFARRVRLTSAAASRLTSLARMAGAAGPASASEPTTAGKGDGKQGSDESRRSPALVAARLRWDGSAGRPPSLRATLRDFLARAPGLATSGRRLQLHRFALLEAGPSGAAAGPLAADDLAPGFFMAFELLGPGAPPAAEGARSASPGTQVAAGQSPGERTPTNPSSPWRPLSASSPPPPLGRSPASTAGGISMGSLADDEDVGTLPPATGASSRRLTALIVGVAAAGSGGGGGPFWDVFCSGPHARWAWRALLGNGGAAGLSFASLSRTRPGAAAAAGPSGAAWPLPAPAFVLSTAQLPGEGGGADVSMLDAADLCWLLNGPEAARARAALAPAAFPLAGGLAACCASVCGRRAALAAAAAEAADGMAAEDGDASDGLAGCAAFDVCVLARSFGATPRFLGDALAAGPQAWSLVAATLARFARDHAASAAGPLGRALPLLGAAGAAGAGPSRDGAAGARGRAEVVLLEEVPGPLLAAAAGAWDMRLGSVRSCAGVNAWLRLCRPAALWSRAAIAEEAGPKARAALAADVVAALQAALAVQLTERLAAEVWDALAEPEVARRLRQRACGVWAAAPGDGSDEQGFVL